MTTDENLSPNLVERIAMMAYQMDLTPDTVWRRYFKADVTSCLEVIRADEDYNHRLQKQLADEKNRKKYGA